MSCLLSGPVWVSSVFSEICVCDRSLIWIQNVSPDGFWLMPNENPIRREPRTKDNNRKWLKGNQFSEPRNRRGNWLLTQNIFCSEQKAGVCRIRNTHRGRAVRVLSVSPEPASPADRLCVSRRQHHPLFSPLGWAHATAHSDRCKAPGAGKTFSGTCFSSTLRLQLPSYFPFWSIFTCSLLEVKYDELLPKQNNSG